MDAGRNARGIAVESPFPLIPISAPDLSGQEAAYCADAVASGYLTHRGEYEARFERELSAEFGKITIATSSGTGALHIALMSLGIGPGDEVIVPNLTFAAPASAVLACGARPRLVDVYSDTWCMDLQQAMDAVNWRTKAILPVHLYGESAGMHLAKLFQLPVVEDNCEGFGYVTPSGTMTACSFYGNKVITTGEGGCLIGAVEKAVKYRDGGFDGRYYHDTAGMNYRMTNMQAAIGLAQLERLDRILAKRKIALDIYNARLKGRGKWLFVVDTPDPGSLAAFLKESGIETRPVFYPLHLMPPYRQDGNFEKSLKAWRSGLCLPTGPHLNEEQAHYVCERVTEWQSRITPASRRQYRQTGLTALPIPN
jgi:perosamine synthetase